jgi:iron complex outermembrane receptor protein
MKLIQKLTTLSLMMTMVLFTLPASVYAQDGALALEEITVTARKKEESLADAPYTITAITSEQIELAGIKQL